jgi:hypothetical protein
MTYVPGYEFDVFVSYAWVDNEALDPADQGWVDALYHALDTTLAQKIGRKEAFSIWRDRKNLPGNQEISSHIPDQVRNSAIFLAILSPGYVSSKYCLQELQTFVNNVKSVENVKTGAAQRLFVVYKDPIDEFRHKMPEEFRDLRKYKFWKPDLNQKPRTLGWPLPRRDVADDLPLYYLNIRDLADEIVVKLDEMKVAADCASSRPPAEVRQKKHTQFVFLAEVTDELDPRRDDVRRYLDQAGIGTLPTGAYYGLARTEFERSFSADLDKCKAFVQLLGPFAGKSPPDVPLGFARLQFDLAKSRRIPILQWRSPDLNLMDVFSAAQRELLQAETVQATSFEEFKRTVAHAVTRTEQPKLERSSFVFVHAAPVDMDRAQALVEVLRDSFDCVRPLYESDAKAEEIQNEIEPKFIECDALVVLFVEAGIRWVEGQIQQFRKLKPKRAKDPRLLAVATASEEGKTFIPIWLRGMTAFPIEEAAARIRAALVV